MKQTIEEQLEIMQAYAVGTKVYRRLDGHDVGVQVEEVGHQFNFDGAIYSLTPMDWCTGKEAIDAYESFMRHGSESDECPSQYYVTLSAEDKRSARVNTFDRKAIDAVDTFSIFIAGAEWVLKNTEWEIGHKDRRLDFVQSMNALREKYMERQAEQHAAERIALSDNHGQRY